MKTVWKLCLALALMVAALFVVSVPAFAAETHTISGEYSLEGGSTKDTSFKLYRVGGFGRDADGKAILVLDKAITDNVPTDITIDVNIEKGDQSDEEWQNAWLTSAKQVSTYLPEDVSAVAEATVTGNDGKFTFTPTVENGLYLVRCESDPIITYTDDDKGLAWTPQPMLVMVLNGDVKIVTKPISEPLVKELTVIKAWDDEGHEALRPKTIKVQLLCNNQPEGEPVTLEEKDGVLQYTWDNLERVQAVYSVREVLTDDIMANYSVIENPKIPDKDTKIITLTNKYDRYSLKLLKKMPAFIANGDQATTTFVFEVKGYDDETAGQGKEVYSTRVGLQVEQGETEKPIEVPDIPRTVKRITVKEIYFGGYTPNPSDAQTATVTVTEDEGRVYSATFTNTFNVPFYSGGVINQFTRKLGENNKPTYEWTKPEGSVFKSED